MRVISTFSETAACFISEKIFCLRMYWNTILLHLNIRVMIVLYGGLHV